MLSSDPKLPQLFGTEEYVTVSFYRRFQERFYTLWRETASVVNRLLQGPATSTDNQVLRFDGTSGSAVAGSDVYITDDGRLYGTALHNNAGAVTGTTNQYVASGTYTPTMTAIQNCTVTSNVAQWMRVGNVVTVSGACTVDPTAGSGTYTEWAISLPIASALTAEYQIAGVALTGYDHAQIKADTTNDRAVAASAVYNDTNNRDWYFTFTYLIL